jgi:long-chain fatty acid transport protein
MVSLAAVVAWALSGVAGAKNGYFKQGYGTQNKAMGGVGMALSLDSYAPGTNAAGIAGMESRVDGSLAYFRPERWLEAGPLESPPGEVSFPLPPGRVNSEREDFFIPSFGLVHQIDADRSCSDQDRAVFP